MNANKHELKIPDLRFPEFTGEWVARRLGEGTSKIGSGSTPLGGEQAYKKSGIRFIRSQNVNGNRLILDKIYISEETNNRMKASVVKPNDVIIPASGETQIDIATASCIQRKGIAIGSDLNIIKTPNNGVFLAYYLNNKLKYEIAKLAQGVAVIHLYPTHLKTLKLLLPSLTEQQKIADCLSAVDRKMAQVEAQVSRARAFKQGLLQRMFI